jgi:hypothetical protein
MTPALDLHPEVEGQRFTMSGLFPTVEAADRAVRRHQAAGKVVIRYEIAPPSGPVLFAVAGRRAPIRQRRGRVPHEYSAPWMAVRLALEAFRAAERAAKTRGTPLRWYKELDERTLHTTLQQMSWHGSLVDVAARFVSNLVIAHPFPNANHRTSTALARLYLEAEGVSWPPYSLKGRGIDRFIRETDPYVLRSKYLLHVMRHAPAFQVAHSSGFRAVAVRPGQTVPLVEEEIRASPADLRRKHEASCRAMIENIDGGSNAGALGSEARKNLREWMRTYER